MNFLKRRLTYKLACPVCNSTQSWWLGLLGTAAKSNVFFRYKWSCYKCGSKLAFPYIAIFLFWVMFIVNTVVFVKLADKFQYWNNINDCSIVTRALFLFSLFFPWSVFLTFFMHNFGVELISKNSEFKKKNWSQNILISERVFALKFGLLKAMIFMWFIIFSFFLVIAVPLCLLGSAVLNF